MADGIIFSIGVATTMTVVTFLKTQFRKPPLMKPEVKSAVSLALSLFVYLVVSHSSNKLAAALTWEEQQAALGIIMPGILGLMSCCFLFVLTGYYWLAGAVGFFGTFAFQYTASLTGPEDMRIGVISFNPLADVPFILAITLGPLLMLKYRQAQRSARLRASALEAKKAEIVAMIHDAVKEGGEAGAEARSGELGEQRHSETRSTRGSGTRNTTTKKG